jgi:glycosyltransferase involved in cell wall biosynthesis
MTDPLVSVLIPARDAADTLPACLASVRRQSEPRFECLVVDDGSADATRAVAERVADEDPRVRVLATPRRGLVPALLDGLAACRAPLVARLDADDLAQRRRLELQAAALAADPTLAGVGCHVRVFPRAGLRAGLRTYESWLRGIRDARAVRAERFVECPLPHPTWMLRRAALARAPWRDAGWPEDYDLLLRWLEAGSRVGVVPRRLVAWRDAPGRMWRTSPAYAPERFVACKARFLARGPLRHHDAYVLWGHGATGRALRRALLGEGRAPAAIVEIHPRRIGRRIGGAPVVRPEALPAVRRGLPLVASVS